MTDSLRFFRALWALVLTVAFLCGLCGCGFFYSEEDISEILGASDPTRDPPATEQPDKIFSLAYYTEEDLDPYTSSSRTNSELLRLCYSGLYAIDASYGAVPVIADRCEAEGNTVLVHLRSGVRFSDGSPVTAEDCVVSYDRAAATGSVWRSAFAYIRSYEAVDSDTFKIVFYSYYPTQLNLLTVPVVKAHAADLAGYPVGCGRYRISTANGFDLVRADCGILPGSYGVDTVTLHGIADREALIYNFNYGRLQAVCADLSLGTEEYRSDSELVAVSTNRFTFLAVNKTRLPLSDVNFSKALTYLLDRNAVVSAAAGTFAVPVWYPLNPAWSVTEQATLNPDIRSVSTASQAFEAAGLMLDGVVRTYEDAPVTLRVLVNRENASRVRAAEAIAEALRGEGFTVEVVRATWDEYRIAVESLNFDLYLGEVNLPANMNASALYSSKICNTGLEDPLCDLLKNSAEGVLNGSVDVRTYVSDFQNVLPFIPLYYSMDALAVNMEIVGEFGRSVSELYWGIEGWEFASSSDSLQ